MRLTQEIYARLIDFYIKYDIGTRRRKYILLQIFLKKKLDFKLSIKSIRKHINNWLKNRKYLTYFFFKSILFEFY
jgi:hypothetical protein